MTPPPAQRIARHVVETSTRIANEIGRSVSPGRLLELLPSERRAAVAALLSHAQVAESVLVRLSLLQDGLRVCLRMLYADDRLDDGELAAVTPLAQAILPYLKSVRAAYEGVELREPREVRGFIELYRRDKAPFGGGAAATEFLGHAMCRGVRRHEGQSHPIQLYERMMAELLDLVEALGSGHEAEGRTRRELEEQLALEVSAKTTTATGLPAPDRRLATFLMPGAIPVFSGIAHANEVWTHDPFDVEEIHSEARDAFQRCVDQVAAQPNPVHGRILLLKGESGAGKTHLLRAFRHQVHSQHLGYVAYMQLTTGTDSYPRYVLRKVIDSLDHAYDPPTVEHSGVDLLAQAVLQSLPASERRRVVEADGTPDELAYVLGSASSELLENDPIYDGVDPQVLQAFLCLARPGKAVRARALKWLRGDLLDLYSQGLLGGLPSRTSEDDVVSTLADLGRLMWRRQERLIVLLFDQIEELADDRTLESLKSLGHTLVRFLAEVPTSVSVLGCVEDHWTSLESALTMPVRDRIVLDPEPVRLDASRTLDEVEALVGRRLEVGFGAHDVDVRDDEPTYPFERDVLRRVANLRTRDVLDWCRRYQERAAALGALPPPESIDTISPGGENREPPADLEQRWNDFLTAAEFDVPDTEPELAALVAWAANELVFEHNGQDDHNPPVEVRVDGRYVLLERGAARRLVAICDKGSQGGGLKNQIEALAARAKDADALPVSVRSAVYPSNPRTQTAATIGRFVANRGRRVTFREVTWRVLAGLRAFLATHREAGVDNWRRENRPLASIPEVAEALAMPREDASTQEDRSEPRTTGEAETSSSRSGDETSSRDRDVPNGITEPLDSLPAPVPTNHDFEVGRTRSIRSERVSVSRKRLTQHAGFLGSPGSGKTTLALNLIEQAAMEDIPAILIDRKGDLAAYAASESWDREESDPDRLARRRALRERLDVAIYTPGDPSGRPLSLPLVPVGLAEMDDAARPLVAQQSANGLGAMLGFTGKLTDRTKTVALGKAIEVLAGLGGSNPTLRQLIELIAEKDDALVNAIGKLDVRVFDRLVNDLEVLRMTSGHLLGDAEESLDAERLFGLGSHRVPGKTRLAILSTKFLGDGSAVQFWLSRLFLELERWASQAPRPDLQALVLLDEADLYVPANGKPPTKEPLMSLIKRARSAGLGILLASQSPGDFDYKARDNVSTWFLGRIAGKTAIDKMKPLLQEAKRNPADRLPNLDIGEFVHLSGKDAVEIKAYRSLIDTVQLPEERILELARQRG